MDITIRRPTVEDLEAVLHDVREADKNEWTVGLGRKFEMAARDFLSTDDEEQIRRVAIGPDGVPLVFWGASEGHVWMFATNSAYRKVHSLHRHLKAGQREMEERYPTLYAFADNRNTVHHRWIKWLGFTKAYEKRVGLFGLPFTMYIKES